MKKPNILIMISDQQQPGTLGFTGKTPCQTPNIDRLAHEGISFDRTLCTSPLCSPSRASIFSGKYAHQVDMLSNNGTLREPPILTDALRKNGYYTTYSGKLHLEPTAQPKAFQGREKELGLDDVHGGKVAKKGERVVADRWFDKAEGQGSYDYSVWCEENGLPDGWTVSDPDVRTHRTPSMSIPKPKLHDLDPRFTYDAWVTDKTLGFLKDRPKEQPFFMVTGWFGPHPPFYIPEPYYSMYDPQDAIKPPNFGLQPNKPRAVENSFYHQLFKDHGEDWEAWKKSMAVYWGYCTKIDDQVGRLINALEEEGILDETLVVFISDHGEQLGSQGLWQKMMPYEESIRVPMVLRLPGRIKAGLRSSANVSLIDIAPTIFSLVGEDIPQAYQGKDLSSSFTDGKLSQSDPFLFSEHKPLGDWHNTCEWRMVTDNEFKYVWNQGDLDELYHLVEDPYELQNLIDLPKYEPEKSALRKRLGEWMVETNDPLLEVFGKEGN